MTNRCEMCNSHAASPGQRNQGFPGVDPRRLVRFWDSGARSWHTLGATPVRNRLAPAGSEAVDIAARLKRTGANSLDSKAGLWLDTIDTFRTFLGRQANCAAALR